MRTATLICSFFLGLCNLQSQDDLFHGNYRLYRHFWFGPGIGTDSILARQVINDRSEFFQQNREHWFLFNQCTTADGFDKYVDSDSIHVLKTADVTDAEIIQQFLLSLEVYNLWFKFTKRRGTVGEVSVNMFFDGKLMKKYKSEWIENNVSYGPIIIKSLSSISAYDFGHRVNAVCDDDACSVYFPPSKAVLKCSRRLYDEWLFPKCLNFISENHRLTWYQIGVPKVDWQTGRTEQR